MSLAGMREDGIDIKKHYYSVDSNENNQMEIEEFAEFMNIASK